MTITGADAIEWIEAKCRLPKGRQFSQPMRLLDYQKEIVAGIFDTPTRRAIVSMGRQNGKTSLAGCLLLLHVCGPRHQRNGLCVSTATTKEQAGLLYDYAAKMVKLNPELRAVITTVDFQKTLRCPELGTVYRALSADGPTHLGLSPFFIVHDELGAVAEPRSELYEIVESGSAAQADPLSLIISTQAADDSHLLSLLIDDAKTGADPETKLFLWTSDPAADPFDEATWRAANPALGVFINIDEVRRTAENARRIPTLEATLRNKTLNQRIDAAAPFISPLLWAENAAAPIPMTRDTRAVGATDLSISGDMTAIVLVGEEGSVYVYAWFPEEGLPERSRVDGADYVGMARDGSLLTTPGRTVDYDTVARVLRRVFNDITVTAMAYDPAFWGPFRLALLRAGFTEEELETKFVKFQQGFISMAPAMRELQTRLLDKKLKHGNHPVLRLAVMNAKAVTDDAGNIKLSKKKSTGRIDALVALAMAVGVMPPETSEPAYQMEVVTLGGPEPGGWKRW